MSHEVQNGVNRMLEGWAGRLVIGTVIFLAGGAVSNLIADARFLAVREELQEHRVYAESRHVEREWLEARLDLLAQQLETTNAELTRLRAILDRTR